jgi:hypothetical protein
MLPHESSFSVGMCATASQPLEPSPPPQQQRQEPPSRSPPALYWPSPLTSPPPPPLSSLRSGASGGADAVALNKRLVAHNARKSGTSVRKQAVDAADEQAVRLILQSARCALLLGAAGRWKLI